MAFLTEENGDYEHREKYSMGAGYYLGQSKYYDWIICKTPIYNREWTIDDFFVDRYANPQKNINYYTTYILNQVQAI